MNLEIKKSAATDYAFTQGLNRNEELVCVKSFCAGAEWAELKWVPVTERLPEEKGMYFVHGKKSWEDSARLHVTRFVPGDNGNLPGFIGVSDPLAWCAIPDSLLNFRP